ncbi:hypothetical protein JHK85_006941 [Glycine max]|nr:hypothetical protein JHK85_006941 [Glycine max]
MSAPSPSTTIADGTEHHVDDAQFSEVDVKLVFKEVTSKYWRKRIVEVIASSLVNLVSLGNDLDNYYA